MPKTKDAFALERLYEDFYFVNGYDHAIPTYNERYFDYIQDEQKQLDYLNSFDCRFEEILLKYLDGGKIKIVDNAYPEFEQARKMLNLVKTRILKDREMYQRITRHIVRLQAYEREIFNRALKSGLDDQIKKQGWRVKILINNYDWLLNLFSGYEKILSQDWHDISSRLDHLCRKNFGARLRQARIAKKMTIEDVARQLGLSRTGYGYYELGQRDLPTPTIYRLATMFDVSTDWLFGLKN